MVSTFTFKTILTKMANSLFQQAPMPNVPRNVFGLQHDRKMSFNIGELTPFCVLDVLPGDSFNLSTQALFRFAPLISPVMHRVDVTLHWFFVPYRILWSNFEDFITTDGAEIPAPYVTLSPGDFYDEGSVADYLGVPPIDPAVEINISPFYFAAYRMIYDEYYRDQNLQPTELFVPLVNGLNSAYAPDPGDIESNPPLYLSLQHDYFTSCLPFAQKGDAVTIPLTFQNNIPVEHLFNGNPGLMRDLSGNVITTPSDIDLQAGPTPFAASVHANGLPATYDPNGTLVVDVQSEAVTLETLRTAIKLQEFLERDMRGGTRYTEKIRAHYGVTSSDSRLQRPEYIGGFKQRMVISEVLSTAQSSNDPGEATQFVGQVAGHAISAGGSKRFRYKAEEHGCIIGIVSVLPDTAYQDGLHRMFSKFDSVNDFAWPSFANLGEQEVFDLEVYIGSASATSVFGYQSRYAEYKYINSSVAGEFHAVGNTVSGTGAYMHITNRNTI